MPAARRVTPIEALVSTPADALPRPRILFVDIDGTLLDGHGILRPAARRAIRAVAGSGVRVVLATGRCPWDGVAELAADLGLEGPHVTMQGAVVGDPSIDAVQRTSPLSPAAYHDALRFAAEFDIDPLVGLIDGYRAVERPTDIEFVSFARGGAYLRPEPDLRRLAGDAPLRIFLPTSPRDNAGIRSAAAIWFGWRASIVWSDLTGIDILAPGVNKGTAATWLATRLHVGMDEVAAVGDARNDAEMLRVAGRSAAMGDAPWDVMDAADVIVPDSDDEGIVDAVAWFFPDLAGAVRASRSPRVQRGSRRRRSGFVPGIPPA